MQLILQGWAESLQPLSGSGEGGRGTRSARKETEHEFCMTGLRQDCDSVMQHSKSASKRFDLVHSAFLLPEMIQVADCTASQRPHFCGQNRKARQLKQRSTKNARRRHHSLALQAKERRGVRLPCSDSPNCAFFLNRKGRREGKRSASLDRASKYDFRSCPK
jgi:hypothetical protein